MHYLFLKRLYTVHVTCLNFFLFPPPSLLFFCCALESFVLLTFFSLTPSFPPVLPLPLCLFIAASHCPHPTFLSLALTLINYQKNVSPSTTTCRPDAGSLNAHKNKMQPVSPYQITTIFGEMVYRELYTLLVSKSGRTLGCQRGFQDEGDI